MFLKKGAGMHQEGGQCPPFERKRGSCQIYNTKMYQPSFSSVSAGKIPRKYQPIPTKNTESQNNSNGNSQKKQCFTGQYFLVNPKSD
jgi:hypothetical protein